jgi:hypothetical protein
MNYVSIRTVPSGSGSGRHVIELLLAELSLRSETLKVEFVYCKTLSDFVFVFCFLFFCPLETLAS